MYFDSAATTQLKPPCVAKAVASAINDFGNPSRGVNPYSLNALKCINATRHKLATLFHVSDAKNIAFTNNATYALNLSIFGLLKPGDKVVTTVMEHNSVLRPLFNLAGIKSIEQIDLSNKSWSNKAFVNTENIELTIINTDSLGNLYYDELDKCVDYDTCAVYVTHASNVTGNIVNIEKVSKIAHKNDAIFICDGAQTAGYLDIDVEKQGIDIFCFSGHKYLYGPQGTAGIYVNPKINLHPLTVGGSGILTYSADHPNNMPTRLEAGTINSHSIAGLNVSIDYINKIGLNNIQKHEQKMLFQFYDDIKSDSSIIAYGDFSSRDRMPICSVIKKGYDSAAISDYLCTNYGIATRAGGHCAPLMHKALDTVESGLVRFSFCYFNSLEEVRNAASILVD